VPSNLIPIAALTQSMEKEMLFFSILTTRPRRHYLKIERKRSHLNNEFDRYTLIGLWCITFW